MEKQKHMEQVAQLASHAAQIILENGAETYRVEDTVFRICQSYGYQAEVIALVTCVMLSVSDGEQHISTLRRVSKRSMNLFRVNMINDLSREIARNQMDVGSAWKALCDIKISDAFGAKHIPIMAGLAAGFFALVFGGGAIHFALALACGYTTQILFMLIGDIHYSPVLLNLLGGIVCSLLTMIGFYAFGLTPTDIEITLSASIIPLISGLMMTNAMRDTLRGDYISGMARGMEAMMIAVMVSIGICLLLWVYLPAEAGAAAQEPPWTYAALFSGAGTLCYCFLLHVPFRAALPASLLGAAAYGGYLLLRDHLHTSETIALFITTVCIAFLCQGCAVRMRMIATVFLCAALIPLVPGIGLYRTVRALLLGDFQATLQTGVQTLLSVGALALGAALGSIRLSMQKRGA